jgi:hypothetical protein
VAALAQAIGARNFIKILHLSQAALNVLLPLRAQGNKFFCAIEKQGLVPWVEFRGGSRALKRLGDGVMSGKIGIPSRLTLCEIGRRGVDKVQKQNLGQFEGERPY